jgi:hypothetical protein
MDRFDGQPFPSAAASGTFCPRFFPLHQKATHEYAGSVDRTSLVSNICGALLMTATGILAAVTLGVFLLAAGGGWLVARKAANRRERRSIYVKSLFLAACGVALSAFAFHADGQLRRTTLHEVIIDGAPSGEFSDEEAVLSFIEFSVEHAGVEHDLMIGPMYRPPTMQRADFEVRILAMLATGDEPAFLEEVLDFAPNPRKKDWQAAYLKFTPATSGPHTLGLRLLTPDIPAIHIRVGDPLKTDGRRIAGY